MGLVSVEHVSFHSTQLLFPRTEELCVREEAWFKACRDSCPTMKAELCDPRFKPLPTVDTKDKTKDVLAVDLKHQLYESGLGMARSPWDLLGRCISSGAPHPALRELSCVRLCHLLLPFLTCGARGGLAGL